MPKPLSPNPAVQGLLSSQIGYELGRAPRLIVRGPADLLGPGARYVITHPASGARWDGTLPGWGEKWGSHWWVAEAAPLPAGLYSWRVEDGTRIMAGDDFIVSKNVLWESTWEATSIEQAVRRQRIATNASGWYDAGCHWQEANSHACFLLGLVDLLDLAPARISATQRSSLLAQIVNGADYLVSLQDLAAAIAAPAGSLVHQSFKFERLIVPGDAAKAAAAWARAARVLPADTHSDHRQRYALRARQALDYLEQAAPTPHLSFNFRAHGLPADRPLPPEPSTPTLQMMLWAAAELAAADPADTALRDRAFALARRLLARQAAPDQAQDGLHGFFHLYDAPGLATKAWSHGMTFDDARMSADIGCTFGLNVWPLLTLLRHWPQAADAPQWREALRRFAFDFLLPACRRNPFLIVPNGLFPDQGLIWFAGLWHGANTIYGLAGAQALDLADLFASEELRQLAHGNLQWIAGLNAGLTRENLPAAHMYSVDLPAGAAVPVSMINGIGARSAGCWLNIRGAICNGFGTGDQFHWDVPPTREHDGPHAFTDEDWITHAGAWLSAVARLARGSG